MAPFICKCGHRFLSNVYEVESLIDWKQFEDLRLEPIRKWLNLTEIQKQILKSLYIDPNLEWESLTESLEKIFIVLDDKDDSNILNYKKEDIHYRLNTRIIESWSLNVRKA